MIKQAVIIKYNDKPVMVLPITTFQSAEDYAKFEKECKQNFEKFIEDKKGVIEELNQGIFSNDKRIQKLEAEIKYIKGELTEEEYTKLIGEGE